MKRKLTKVLCLMLSIIMLVPFGMMSSFAASCNCGQAPYVYIQGQVGIDAMKEDGTVYFPMDESSFDVAEIAKNYVPLLIEAVKTNEWAEWDNAVYTLLSKNYREIMPAPDGSIKENTGIRFHWNENNISTAHGAGKIYNGGYNPDWRLSPMDVADDINNFVEAVKRKTGHDKVILVSRCMGCTYAMAYLQKYGYNSIEKTVFLSSVHNGTGSAEAILTGNIQFDSKSAARYFNTEGVEVGNAGNDVIGFLTSLINALRETYTDSMVVYLLDLLYAKSKDSIFAPLMREYYGVGGAIGSVNENFEEAIEYMYPTDELKEAYAVQIQKARDFHYNVQLKSNDILRELEANGIPVYTVVQYGFQQIPIGGEKTNKVGDLVVGADRQAYGTTVSDVTSVLPDDYIKERTEKGFGSFISPDSQIDASTCPIPERTWFIKNLNHDFTDAIHRMVDSWVFSPVSQNVNSNEKYPQFMIYSVDDSGREILETLTKENSNTINWDSYENKKGDAKKIGDMIVSFFKGIFDDFLGKIFKLVDAIKSKFH